MLQLYDPGTEPEFRPFDLFACWGRNPSARTISAVTCNPFGRRGLRYGPSHVAFAVQTGDRVLWAESTMACRHPCLHAGAVVDGCQLQDPRTRIRDYVEAGGRVEVYRLVPIWQLKPGESRELTRIVVEEFVGRGARYDLDGALCSGLRVLKLLDVALACGMFPRADLHRLFCSEWAAALAMRLGRLAVANCSKYTPAGLVRRMVANGVAELHRTYHPPCPAHCEFPVCTVSPRS